MAETKPKPEPESAKADSAHLTAGPIQLTGEAKVLHKPKAVRLDGFPKLVYSSSQFGPGVRTEDNQTPIVDIVNAVAETPDYEIVAERFGTTVDHVAEAVQYAVKAGYASESGESADSE